MALPAEAGSVKIALSEIVDNPSASDQDESESENDVPYFSDIEAMVKLWGSVGRIDPIIHFVSLLKYYVFLQILEMDLAPHDQDSYTSRHGNLNGHGPTSNWL